MQTVAHLVSPYLFRTGSWVHAQLRHAAGHRPIVCTQRLQEADAFPFSPVHCITASLGRWGRIRNRLIQLRGDYDPALYLPVLRREQVKLLHAHLGWEGARAVAIARASGLPLITSFYGRDATRQPRRPWWALLYRRLFREGAAFLAEGPVLARRLETIGCPAKKIHLLHLGIDPARIAFRERRPRPGGAVEILVSASLRAKKGVPAAVGAFAAIAPHFPAARLRILGDGPERRRVQRAIRTHGLQERVTLEGYVAYERHLEALEQADLFLAASRTAPDGDSEGGAPVALIEAQAAGLPVIATRHADIPEIIEDGATGLLSPEFDDAELAQNLYALLAHPERWAAMGIRARARVEAEFDVHTQARRLSALYVQCLGEQARG